MLKEHLDRMLWKDGASMGFPTSRVYGPPWLPETQSTALPAHPVLPEVSPAPLSKAGPRGTVQWVAPRENGCPLPPAAWERQGGRGRGDVG